MKKVWFLSCIFLIQLSLAQVPNRITGFIGLYHTSSGYTYTDSVGLDSVLLQRKFSFGEFAIPNQLTDHNFLFADDVDSCVNWKANRVFAIIQPPSEGGVYNQPNDTSINTPFDISNGPGMIQGGARFSRLSKQYGNFCGAIIDDWNSDPDITGRVRDAIRGRSMDVSGHAVENSLATTPDNKLYIVIYSNWVDPAYQPSFDGVSFWYYDNQNCCYSNFDSDITAIRYYCPQKEIFAGIYILNGKLGWTDPVGVKYMLQHAMNRYDDGDINGITLFAGPYLTKDVMSVKHWNELDLLHQLDSIYYPFLGEGNGRITDCESGKTLSETFVKVFCVGRVSGDTCVRSRQKTDSSGNYRFGVWAGNRITDSTYYWIQVQKEGYEKAMAGFWMKRNGFTHIPDITLCPSKVRATSDFLMLIPNPAGSMLQVICLQAIDAELVVSDVAGKILFKTMMNGGNALVNVEDWRPGCYYIKFQANDGTQYVRKCFIK